jgi:hypothetical protein
MPLLSILIMYYVHLRTHLGSKLVVLVLFVGRSEGWFNEHIAGNVLEYGVQ